MKPRLPGTITPRRPKGTPAGQPTPSELDPGSYDRLQLEMADTYCRGRDTQGGMACLSLCDACKQHANRAINAAYVKRNRLTLEHGGGDLIGRIRVIDRDSAEGQAILAAREHSTQPTEADPTLAALASVLR